MDNTTTNIDIKEDLQEHFEIVLDELGNPREWTQEKTSQFYKKFFKGSTLNKHLTLKIIEIKEYPNFNLFISTVINHETFKPFWNPYLTKNWTVAFTYNKEATSFKVGDLIIATTEELNLEEISNENRKLDLLSIDVSSIQYTSLETSFIYKYGEAFTKRIVKQFGSLEEIAPFIIAEFEKDVDEQIGNLEKYLDIKVNEFEDQELRLEAEHTKIKNERTARYKELELEIEEEYQSKLKKYEIEKDKLDNQERKLEGRRRNISENEKQLQSQEDEIFRRQEELVTRKKSLQEYENSLNSQFERFNLLNPFSQVEAENVFEDNIINWNEQKDIVAIIQGALHAQCNLQYEREVIESFLGALMSNQIIILNGPSGTGKSSLVSNFSNIIFGAKTSTIRVQSSWTDKQDLLGFFNPIDYQYISTPFLDSLIEACNNKKYPYFICLDEMNLAHVEYYFAEFLSAREEKEPKISLYSSHFQKLAMNNIMPFLKYDEDNRPLLHEEELSKLSTSDRIRVQNCFDLCFKYPAEIVVPPNVRFVGTMNMDHTVKGLSPKMIDRSFVVNIEYPENEEVLLEELEQLKVNELIAVNMEDDLLIKEMDIELRYTIKQINPLLSTLGARLNRRSLDQIGTYAKAVSSESTLDQVVIGKILPRINVLKNDKTTAAFRDLLASLSISEDTKDLMNEMINEGRTITYWR
ncbi:AAA family ATPase [Bacillus sp. B1-b2]|uniref:AAA family ATPase n=1 Tax=Bacillus sp. B1-b2 TaxID=2653201 RepID=UPI001262A256|nr:AAA family ATPase [Bacillus sp. B1-b2]KAB7672560.1 AAA domain-containing protein [Bacillus sp. B1-b2]